MVVSSYIKPHRGKKSPPKGPSQADPAPANTPALPRPLPSPTTRKTVPLRGGGTLTLQLDVDLFDLDAGERQHIFSLIDQIQAFEKRKDSS
jgi:hypothetical protein